MLKEDFCHIEENISEEFKEALKNELEKFTDEQNKRF